MVEADFVSGSAKPILEFAREAAHEHPGLPKIELSVLTFSRGKSENSLTAAIRDMGVACDIISERHRFDRGVIPQLQSVVRSRRTNLIWSNSVKSHFLVRWAGLNQSRAWVAFHHGYTTTDLKMRIYNQLDRWSLPIADRVMTSSAAFVQELQRGNVHPNRVHVQHMPIRPLKLVSEQRITALRYQLGLDAQTRVLLSIGRLSREKGHAELIRVFAKMRECPSAQPLRLVLVGEGPERLRIEKLCRKLKLTEFVTLTGHQDIVDPYYAIADVFVLPSHSEGSPNVLLEAMAAGVPVVATAVGGIPEIASSGRNALLVMRGDTVGLAFAITQLLTDQALRDRLVSAAGETVSRRTPGAYFQSIVSVFHEALLQ